MADADSLPSARSLQQIAGRTVLVHLPPGYDPDRPEPYPLLLLQDGQNLAAWREDALGGSWRADETIDRLVDEGALRPIVLAGIDHGGEDRVREFTPTRGRVDGAGQAATYGRWLVDDLLPALAGELHVRTDFDGVGLGGSSLGGLITLWIASMWPGHFGRILLMSPSVWWDGRVILRHLREQPLDPATRVWIDAGLNEGRAVVRDARALRDLLRGQGHRSMRYVEDPDGDHSEESWGRRLGDALTYLYK
jgi:enterochelin esterase-like enzyme